MATGQTTIIGTDTSPAVYGSWNPQNDEIIFYCGGTSVCTADSDGNNRQEIPLSGSSSGVATVPKWSPDATHILAVRPFVGDWVRVYEADGSNQNRLWGSTSYPVIWSIPAWSPSGARVAFARGVNGPCGTTQIVDSTTGDLTTYPSGRPLHQPWSPDGSMLVAEWPDGCPSATGGIYVQNADGSGQELIVDTPADEWGAAWSPADVKVGPPPPIPQETRIVVYVQGINSDSSCPLGDGFLNRAPSWLQGYLETEPWMQPHVDVVGAVYFSYRVDSPPDELAYCNGGLGGNGAFPRYDHGDTCAYRIDSTYYDKLKALVQETTDLNPGAKVTIVAHSQGGLIASYLVGRLSSEDASFLRDRIASVVTFDSFPEGLPAGQFFATPDGACFFGATIYEDWDEAHGVAQTASTAAQNSSVAFYTIDAGDSLVPEEFTHITDERLHRQFAGDHTEVWTDGSPAKQDFVGCAVVVWDNCTFLTVPVQQGLSTEDQMTVGPPATLVRFSSSFGSIVRMTLISPSGTVYGPAGAGPTDAYSVDAVSEVYEIVDPESGLWTVRLYGEEVDPGGENVLVTLLEEGTAGVAVGGIAELPVLATERAESAGTSASDTWLVRSLVGGGIVAVVMLGGLAWRSRRRGVGR